MTRVIAIQGQQASFHDIAARQLFGNSIKLIYCQSFKDTFEVVKNNMANVAVCAIENSLFGSINETYDLLLAHDFTITAETYLRVEQCLIGLPSTNIKDITEVMSHPVAIAQCEQYLNLVLPNVKRLEFHDTAAAVERIKELNNSSTAAIASRTAAKLYGMQVLATDIETHKENYTRFIAIESTASAKPSDTNKTSMVIKTSHNPGALYAALGAFAKQSINLSKLQSRPIIGKAWHYMFYVDVDAGMNDQNLIDAINELQSQRCDVKILGSYKAGKKV